MSLSYLFLIYERTSSSFIVGATFSSTSNGSSVFVSSTTVSLLAFNSCSCFSKRFFSTFESSEDSLDGFDLAEFEPR